MNCKKFFSFAAMMFLFIGCSAESITAIEQEQITFRAPAPGTDISPLIQSADTRLGTKKGTINVPSGSYIIGETITVSAGHTLKFSKGTYDCQAPNWVPVFIMNAGSSLIGANNDTVFLEAPGLGFVVDAGTVVDGGGPGVPNVVISNFRILGQTPQPFYAYASSIAIGNGTGWKVHDLFFDHTQANPIQAGFGSQEGNHSDNIDIYNNLFDGIATSCVAIVNAHRVTVRKNDMRGCYAGLDIEPNTPTDAADQFIIKNNTGLSGWIQGANTGPGEISGNDIKAMAFNGVHDVIFKNNTVSSKYIYNSGLYLEGAVNCIIDNNTFVDCGEPASFGGGAQAAITIFPGRAPDLIAWVPAQGNVISNNKIYAKITGSATILEACYPELPESCVKSVLPDYNTYTGNTLGPALADGLSPETGNIVTIGLNDILKNNNFIPVNISVQ